jgi:hypothetical protein
MEAIAYEQGAAEAWDEVVVQAPMATFLHTRRFLAYHGDRFQDASLLLTEGDEVLGVLPAACDPADPKRVTSHPGATFGGLVHDGALGGERMLTALEAACAAYRERGFESLIYKAVPWIYQQLPSGDDLHALFRLGAQLSRVDLSCAIDLDLRRAPSKRRERGLKKALGRGAELTDSLELVPEFWQVLQANLKDRFGVNPVHSVEEIQRIHDLFPDDVKFLFALLEGQVVAGTVIFGSPRVNHMQYNGISERGREISALDAIYERCIESTREERKRFFDFGISTEAEGQELNEGLYRFKYEFGGGGVAHEFYELSL